MIYSTLNDMDQSNVQAGEMYTLQLPSKQESITLLENLIEEISDRHQVSEDTFANMMTCLSEAVNNAIAHGNKFDDTKKVIVNANFFDAKVFLPNVGNQLLNIGAGGNKAVPGIDG